MLWTICCNSRRLMRLSESAKSFVPRGSRWLSMILRSLATVPPVLWGVAKNRALTGRGLTGQSGASRNRATGQLGANRATGQLGANRATGQPGAARSGQSREGKPGLLTSRRQAALAQFGKGTGRFVESGYQARTGQPGARLPDCPIA